MGHIWEQQWGMHARIYGPHGAANGAYMGAYMGHMGAAMGHACAHTWATWEQQMGHAYAHIWPIAALVYGPFLPL